jgi:hypothetical protein
MEIADVNVIVHAAPKVTVPPAATSVLNVVKVHGAVTVPLVCRAGECGPAAPTGGTTASSNAKVTIAISPQLPHDFHEYGIEEPRLAGIVIPV